MTFDPSIGVGALISLITLVFSAIGGVGAWYTFKAKLAETSARVKDLEAGNDRLTDKYNSLELSVARECVKRDDLREVESRLSKRIDDVEHAVRNSVAKVTGELKEIIRDTFGRGAPR